MDCNVVGIGGAPLGAMKSGFYAKVNAMRMGKRERALERARLKRASAVSDLVIATSWPRDRFDITGKGSKQWGFGDKRTNRPSKGKSIM